MECASACRTSGVCGREPEKDGARGSERSAAGVGREGVIEKRGGKEKGEKRKVRFF